MSLLKITQLPAMYLLGIMKSDEAHCPTVTLQTKPPHYPLVFTCLERAALSLGNPVSWG